MRHIVNFEMDSKMVQKMCPYTGRPLLCSLLYKKVTEYFFVTQCFANLSGPEVEFRFCKFSLIYLENPRKVLSFKIIDFTWNLY